MTTPSEQGLVYRLWAVVRLGAHLLDAFYSLLLHTFIPLCLLAILGMVSGTLGKDLGIAYLFWPPEGIHQVAVGMALGLTVTQLLFLGFLLDYGKKRQRPGNDTNDPRGHWSDSILRDEVTGAVSNLPGLGRASTVYLTYHLCLLSILSCIGWGLIDPKFIKDLPHSAVNGMPMWITFLATATLVPVALAYFGARRIPPKLAADPKVMHYWAALDAGILVSVFALSSFTNWLPPAVPICFLIAICASVYGFASWGTVALRIKMFDASTRDAGSKHAGRIGTMRLLVPPGGLVLAAVLVLAMGIGGSETHKYRVEALADSYAPPGQPLSGYPYPIGPLAPIEAEQWLNNVDGPLIIVNASGGGITAAAWTLACLLELEEKFKAFPARLRLITGASGGMLGAAAWSATLLEKPENGQFHGIDADELYERTTRDSLSPVVRRLIFNDIWRALFLPGPIRHDRGEALENAWKDANPALAGPLESQREGELAGWRPSLIFSPMFVEDGRRLLISNLDLSALVQPGSRFGSVGGARPAMELSRLLPDLAPRLPIATAARMAATFPFVTPAASLPTTPRRRVVDAGYYDNYGTDLAVNWLIHACDRERLAKPGRSIYFIEIDAYTRAPQTNLAVPSDDDTGLASLARSVEDLTSPVNGLLKAQARPQSYRNDQLLETFREYIETTPGTEGTKVHVIRLTNSFPASLSWALTASEKKELRARAKDEVSTAIRALPKDIKEELVKR